MSSVTERKVERFDPNFALRPGTFDAAVLLTIWCARKAFFPLIWLGLSVATVGFGDIDTLGDEIATIEDPGAAVSSLLSPLGGIVLALGVRLVANFAAVLAAFPLTSWTRTHEYTFGWRLSRWFRSWWDRIYLARAYRSIRWTAVVRELARHRLGDRGRAFRIVEVVIYWAGPVFFIVLLVALSISGP